MPGVTSLVNESLPSREAKSLAVGNIVVDFDGFRVMVEDALIDLTLQEFELLRIFVSQPDSIILYDELALALWGTADERNRLRLGVLLCRLRAKLAASHPYRFETVRERGYGLLAPRVGGIRSRRQLAKLPQVSDLPLPDSSRPVRPRPSPSKGEGLG